MFGKIQIILMMKTSISNNLISRLNNVKWSNIVQLKFIKEKPKAVFYNCEHESEYKCCNFRTESAFTQNVAKATNTKTAAHNVVKTNIKCSIGITVEKKEKFTDPMLKRLRSKKPSQVFPVITSSILRQKQWHSQIVDEGNFEN